MRLGTDDQGQVKAEDRKLKFHSDQLRRTYALRLFQASARQASSKTFQRRALSFPSEAVIYDLKHFKLSIPGIAITSIATRPEACKETW